MTQAATTTAGAHTSAVLGRVEAIFIAQRESAPMQQVQTVRARAGVGLDEDRYGSQRGTFSKGGASGRVPADQQVTLIEAEAVEGARREHGVELEPRETRRNILTRGVALNHLVGREFKVGGEVVLRGIELCEPCGHLEKLTREGVRKSLIHRGGLRAEIVSGGMIGTGDSIAANAAAH